MFPSRVRVLFLPSFLFDFSDGQQGRQKKKLNEPFNFLPHSPPVQNAEALLAETLKAAKMFCNSFKLGLVNLRHPIHPWHMV